MIASDSRGALQGHPAGSTRATWPRWSASRPLSLTADKPWDAERLLRHALKQSAHVPLALRGTRAGADRPRARAGGRRGRAAAAEDRTREPAVLGHGGRGGDAPAAAGAGARGLRAGGGTQAGRGAHPALDRPCAEDPRPAQRQRDLVPGDAGDQSGHGRGLLESRGPEELRLQRRGDRHHAGAAAAGAAARGCRAGALRARQGLRAPPGIPARRSSTTHRATRCAAWMPPSTSRTSSAAAHASRRSSTPAFFAAHAGARRPEPRPDLHRRPAALGLDAARADPRQPFAR